MHRHGWIAVVGVLVLVVAHGVVIAIVPRTRFSVGVLAGVVMALVALKYSRWKRRR